MSPEPFHARPLDPGDHVLARALCARAGAHGVYVANFLTTPRPDGSELLGFYAADGLAGLALFGARGNLILLVEAELSPAAVAAAVAAQGTPWRIALAPAAYAAALRDAASAPLLVDREQHWFGMSPQAATAALLRDDVRPAEPADRRALVAACLELNEADLGVDPKRVHRAWLRETIDRRIRDGTTLVLGPPGDPHGKLDLGSTGSAGWVLEGVFTFRPYRRRGLASALVATVARSADTPLVCLHVAADNAPAIHAYQRAGMQRMGACRLLLQAG